MLILTTFEEDEYIVAALRAGASGFIGKGSEPDEIVHAVRAVHAGDALLSPAATRSPSPSTFVPLNPERVRGRSPRAGAAHRTRARGAAAGGARRSNQEIADELHISPHTAKTHVNRVMAKVYAHDRAQLVILAYESGLRHQERDPHPPPLLSGYGSEARICSRNVDRQPAEARGLLHASWRAVTNGGYQLPMPLQ